ISIVQRRAFEMIGIYFSGTGNTRHCIEKFVYELDIDATCISNCPSQAMTLLGSTLYEQCKMENYL
ncbi:MAG: hypothetical protein RR052_00510, partial [Oscillospiraceae bacterium]